MIGLGSNRLTCCRRGGMSVRQIGSGGMRLVASPYSAQATAALKDAFTAAQWQTIKAYGFAHPEIVGYMNAYAPEDAKIAYSLVEGIGTRWLVGDGQAYIRLLYHTTKNDNIELHGYKTSNSNWFYGTRPEGYSQGTIFFTNSDTTVRIANCSPNGDATSVSSYSGEIMLTTNGRAFTLNGRSYTMPAPIVNSIEYDMCLFGLFDSNVLKYPTTISNCKIAKFKVTGDNNLEVYPFIRKINGVDTCGMIDVLSGTFYQNAGSGSFTISESPAS